MQNKVVKLKSGVISQHSQIWLQGKLIDDMLMGQLRRNTGWKSCPVGIKGLGNRMRSLTDIESNIHNCIIKVYCKGFSPKLFSWQHTIV